MNTLSKSDFISEHFHFNKPLSLNDSLPSCLDINNFFENQQPYENDVLPYISYGGVLHFDRNIDADIQTGDYYMCGYISEGRIQIETEAESYIGETHLVFICYKDSIYNIKSFSKDTTIHTYFVSGLAVDSYMQSLMKNPENIHSFHKDFDMHSFIINSLSKIDYLLTEETRMGLFRQSLLFQYVFVRLLNVQDTTITGVHNASNHVTRLKKILDTRYQEAHTLDSLQEELGLNKYRLCRDFSKTYNIAPLKYLNTVRMSKAKELLLDTENTIVEIGNAVGIPNTTHFINQFKKETGDTPLKYRQHHIQLGDSIPDSFLF
ncbi:helix-turn-helix domain-containing protein [Pseudobutyrivibrio xylanivorans]|uniref:AraC-type DNA-binding protein n=1 Tax=Pseudobutyrivibrio xylanivorans TaxID=185007 RepID=A0A1G5RRY5_PSEXY|nr:AraC family transcriptional regulator [Pseudobutyrivibrio xylanivorans]SCZ76853.1 AraC-type DNA-binding protein [Pseudobutyrivibrio xylanivorans]